MKLLHDFFQLLNFEASASDISARIRLNPEHIVYVGHFPGHPVTPGVVQLQMVHELLEYHLQQKVQLKSLSQAKFLKIINPKEVQEVDVKISIQIKEPELAVKAKFEQNGQACFHLQATYINVVPPR